ncbi:MAG: iron complex transport system ATP-binding protein [Myxococcota bacterium]|jgi:iron complex transport system ATP-binding protein
MSTPGTGLEARGLVFDYDAAPVLSGLTLSLSGGVTAIVGPNGAGKSTLLRLLAGLLRPTGGGVLLDGHALRDIAPRTLAQQVAVVLDPPEMGHAWTALELVLMGRAPHLRLGRFEDTDDVDKALSALATLASADLARRVFSTLSAGERQRVLLARALCQETPYLLLDEPTSHLDPGHALRVGELCRSQAAAGQTVVWVVHDLNLAARFADVVAVLHEGNLAALGPPAEVLTEMTLAAVYGVRGRRIQGDDAVPTLVFEGLIGDD